MKKLIVLALSAVMALSVSAHGRKAEKAGCKKDQKECKLSREERIEIDIKILSDELYLSEEQAAKFAETYREYKAEQAKLKEKFKAKFAKDLNDRQVERVLHFHGPKIERGPRPEFEKAGPRPDFEKRGPKPEAIKGHRS